MNASHNIKDWYDTPLYYDIIFDAETEKEADFMDAMMRRYAGARDGAKWRVLEPACGTGRLVAALAERGHDVHGFDGNANMLKYAEERLAKQKRRATLWQDRLEEFRTPPRGKFDLAHCLVSTFKYVPDEAGAVSHLEGVAKVLRKGGIYLLGVHLTDYDSVTPEHERWEESRDGIHVICNTHTWPPDRKARKERLRTRLRISRRGETWEQETNWTFRTYNAAQLRALVKKVPALELAGCYTFDYDPAAPCAVKDESYAVVLVLRKR